MIECVSPERAAYLRCKKRNKICIRMAQVLLLVGFFAIWELAAKMNWIDSFLISCPSRMWQTIRDLWASGDLLLHLGVSCLETVVGFVLGTILGAAVAVAAVCMIVAASVFAVVKIVPLIALAVLLAKPIDAGSVGIIGGADGPTSIFVTTTIASMWKIIAQPVLAVAVIVAAIIILRKTKR